MGLHPGGRPAAGGSGAPGRGGAQTEGPSGGGRRCRTRSGVQTRSSVVPSRDAPKAFWTSPHGRQRLADRKTSEKHRESPLIPMSPLTAEVGTGLARPQPKMCGIHTCIRSVMGGPNKCAPTSPHSYKFPAASPRAPSMRCTNLPSRPPSALGWHRPSSDGRRGETNIWEHAFKGSQTLLCLKLPTAV